LEAVSKGDKSKETEKSEGISSKGGYLMKREKKDLGFVPTKKNLTFVEI